MASCTGSFLHLNLQSLSCLGLGWSTRVTTVEAAFSTRISAQTARRSRRHRQDDKTLNPIQEFGSGPSLRQNQLPQIASSTAKPCSPSCSNTCVQAASGSPVPGLCKAGFRFGRCALFRPALQVIRDSSGQALFLSRKQFCGENPDHLLQPLTNGNLQSCKRGASSGWQYP